MNDRAFRLDFFIAIAALLVSALTAATLVYQTRVIGDQFAATIWPYLSLGTTYSGSGETIEVTNDGLGPALIRSAQLSVDGVPERAWNDYVGVLAQDPALRAAFIRTRGAVLSGAVTSATLSMSSIGPSSTIRPGETKTLLKLAFSGSIPAQALIKHLVTIEFCYCSLNHNCWMLRASPGHISQDPSQVPSCANRVAIESNSFADAVPAKRPASRRSPLLPER